MVFHVFLFFFQAEDGIRDLVRSRGLGDVYKRQPQTVAELAGLVIRSRVREQAAEVRRLISGSTVYQPLSLIPL